MHSARETARVMMKAVLPAMALFGAAALGLVALRDQLAESADAKPVLAEVAKTNAELTEVSASQIRTASLRKEGDGHYWASARVNGVNVKFPVDTGATLWALNKRDARRIGLELDNLQRNLDVRTAAGRVKASSAVIKSVGIDGVEVKDVSAVVMEDGLEYSLLGMSFLNRLDSWVVTPNAIIIHE